MQELALDYPLPKLIIECRGLAAEVSYTDKLPKMINAETGRVSHLVSSSGNGDRVVLYRPIHLQNIPIRNEEGRRIRQAFVAQHG
ncbi:DNA polymerase [Vibrio chagasii]|nr:DNA polymerase [Vibrio chagasii]